MTLEANKTLVEKLLAADRVVVYGECPHPVFVIMDGEDNNPENNIEAIREVIDKIERNT